MAKAITSVVRLDENDLAQVVEVLAESFSGYPVMRFIFGADARDYDQKGKALIRFFVMARLLRNEFVLGIGDLSDLDGVALVSRPSAASPPALGALRERLWADLGAEARSRYEAYGAASARFGVNTPHLHLNMVGVRGRAQGKGLGRRLIEHVHRLSRNDPASGGVTLSTEDPRNVSFYEHLGYQVVGRTTVVPELDTWFFFRPD